MLRRLGIGSLALLLVTILTNPLLAQDDERAALAAEMNGAYQAKDWKRAIAAGERLFELVPGGRQNSAYNVACVHALAGDGDSAIEWLEKAVKLGFANIELLENDADLSSIRGDRRYSSVVTAAKRTATAVLDALRTAANDSTPIIVFPEGENERTPRPVIVALHGFGSNGDDLIELYRQPAASIGAILVAPTALLPVPGSNNGFQWGPSEHAEVQAVIALRKVQEKYPIDREKIILTGFSQGGFMAFSIGLRNPLMFRGVMPVAGGYQSSMLATRPQGKFGQRYYLMVGSEDGSADGYRRAKQDFDDAGIVNDLRIYRGIGHTYPQNSQQEITRGLRFLLAEK